MIRRSRLGVLGLASLAVYLSLALKLDATSSRTAVWLFLAHFLVLFGLYGIAASRLRALPERSWFVPTVLVFAVLFRLAGALAGLPQERPWEALGRDVAGEEVSYQRFLLYDNDVWRYLWDGHVAASGLSPYRFTPAEIAEAADTAQVEGEPSGLAETAAEILSAERWWDVLDNVSFQDYTTVYPPLAQALFRLSHALAPGSVFVFKLLLGLIDLGTCLALVALLGELGLRRDRVLLYAWNPLVVKEIAGSGHVDGLMILFLVLAVWLFLRARSAMAMGSLALAALAKLGALVLAPLFIRRSPPRTWWVLPAVAIVASLPMLFLDGALAALSVLGTLVGGLGAFARDWVFNPGPWGLAKAAFEAFGVGNPSLAAHVVTKAILLLFIVATLLPPRASNESTVRQCFYLLAGIVLLNPAVMPWYLLWALPFAIAAGQSAWIALTALSMLSYLFYIDQTEHAWWLWVEYLGFAAAVVVARLSPTRPGRARAKPRLGRV